MKKKIIFLATVFVCLISSQIFATESQEKMYLIQMINQLEALKPLIIAAEKEQPRNLRLQFHYMAYHDASKKLHNGLLEDINEIEKGIQAKLNIPLSEPHRFAAIKGDYIGNER